MCFLVVLEGCALARRRFLRSISKYNRKKSRKLERLSFKVLSIHSYREQFSTVKSRLREDVYSLRGRGRKPATQPLALWNDKRVQLARWWNKIMKMAGCGQSNSQMYLRATPKWSIGKPTFVNNSPSLKCTMPTQMLTSDRLPLYNFKQ